jgi:hypothetical protein
VKYLAKNFIVYTGVGRIDPLDLVQIHVTSNHTSDSCFCSKQGGTAEYSRRIRTGGAPEWSEEPANPKNLRYNNQLQIASQQN